MLRDGGTQLQKQLQVQGGATSLTLPTVAVAKEVGCGDHHVRSLPYPDEALRPVPPCTHAYLQPDEEESYTRMEVRSESPVAMKVLRVKEQQRRRRTLTVPGPASSTPLKT